MPQSASATSSVAASPPATPTTSSSSTGGGPLGGPAPPKTAPPTPIQPTQFARVYASAHPLLLLGLLAWRFPALVADPVAEMTSVVPFLAALQTFFVMTVLPPAGSAPATLTPATTTVGKEDRLEEKEKESAVPRSEIIKPNKGPYRRKAPFASSSSSASPVLAVGRALTTRLTPTLISLFLTTFLATPALALLLVLFGAPLTTHNAQTLLCAAHMAVLTSIPLVYVHGVDSTVWKDVWGFARPGDLVWGGALGACVGAWLGAVPIPLDWDRPWQAFPITILVGAYLGYAVGCLLGRTCLFGSVIDLSESGGAADGDVDAEVKKNE
ncbi:hypothetical protein P168DRAFT_326867 [Aspergillus campestris IBT 28561]|uniref:Glycosylphosphatidylinositol anchor biosynthesis protein 11 n=1 Tax=Aspergillus campestris (strain IBT 28561) TaxID=1392248 RepID=A0A2I1D5K2_ASPC2|nr:uncharacterized protein P168DRAFT_326867 [Aspergillus campestris IBT 28561]PKY05156.1 hypothetical protein P168DRAFT_326867 [Aspergillus campestris IBT 28561]